MDLKFAADATQRVRGRLGVFPVFHGLELQSNPLIRTLLEPAGNPVDYLEKLLKICCDQLSLPFTVIRASALGLDSSLTGQAQIIAIANLLKATSYVNLPGGRLLYDSAEFKKNNIDLQFIPDYQGPLWSILQRILTENISDLRKEIIQHAKND